MSTTNVSNYTTLYSTTAGSVSPAQPYGNSNVEAFLNAGTDGGNTVENILANGTIYANGNIEANGYFVGDGGYLSNITANSVNANFANFAGNVTVASQPNITSVGTLVSLDVTGNIDTNNYIIANGANLAGGYDINSAGYYFPRGVPITSPLNYNPNIAGLNFSGTATSGSNSMTGVTLFDRNQGGTLNLNDWQGYLPNQCVGYNDGVGGTSDLVFPIGTTITSVDPPNNIIYFSNNSTYTGFVNIVNGTLLSNVSAQTYLLTSQPVIALASATDATSNAITLNNMFAFASFGYTTGTPVQFLGSTAFGNINIGTQYYVGNVDIANSQISISTSNTGTPDVQLTTATGNLLLALQLTDNVIRPLNGGYYYSGPWPTNPMTANATNFTETPNSGLIGNITFTTTNNFVKPIDFNDSATLPTLLSGQFTRVQNGLIVSDAEYGTSSLFGTLGDTFPLNGVGVVKTGLEANAVNGRPNMQIVNYTDNGADSASITNPGNPPAFSFSAFTGNVNTNPNDTYLRSGRVIGRIGWYGPMQNNGVQYIQPGSTPAAGIYVQALGDWNNATNANIPMVMAFQYSPLNAATSTPNYQRINRTFLQAANNTTTIGGATNIQFKPLARSTNATNNRSISALGNVSINPQTFVDIGGYTAGDAVSNGAGALLNVTTTASTWNGNVALRFSRTVGNTANMEFQLPVGSSNTLILRDNVTGNTIATFTNPNVVVNGNITSNNANLGNLALANFFQGDGGLLSNINVSNITGNANFANFAGNLINGNSNINIPVTDGAITINPNGIANAYVFEASGQSNINPPSTLNHIIRINTYGRSGNAAQANPISYFKSRGTSASPLSVNPGDELSRMMSFGHNGTAIQGNSFSMIRTIVDSSYVANSANIPIGITFTVTDTNGGVNNQAKTHNFFSNGNVTFAQTVNSGNLTTGGTLSVTGNANVGNLGTSGVIIATGNITGGNFITNGNITAGSSGANSSFIFNGDKTTNSGMSLFDAQFSVISNNTPTLTGYSPFRFAYYDNANASINPQRNFRGRGTFAAPAAVQSGDETWKSVYTTYADSGNTVFQIFESNIVITQNNLAGNVTANYNISPSSVYSNINLGASNTYANSLVLSNNLSAVSANVNANTYLYANGEVNTTDRVYASNVEVKTNGFVKLASYTAAGLTAITGQIGWMAAVSDSAGGGNPNGMIAFWDTTNTRWSYVHDNSAV